MIQRRSILENVSGKRTGGRSPPFRISRTIYLRWSHSLFFCEKRISAKYPFASLCGSISPTDRYASPRRILHRCLVSAILTRIRWLRYVSQMNCNSDAAPVTVAGRSSRSQDERIRSVRLWQFRIEWIAEAVFGPLHLKDLAAIAIGVAPPASGQQIVAARHHFAQYFGYIDICLVAMVTRYLSRGKSAKLYFKYLEYNTDLIDITKL